MLVSSSPFDVQPQWMISEIAFEFSGREICHSAEIEGPSKDDLLFGESSFCD